MKWYLSKTVWLGVLEFLIGVAGLLVTFFEAGDFTAAAITALVMGALTVLFRVLSTGEKLTR